jgi:hypothetical protein
MFLIEDGSFSSIEIMEREHKEIKYFLKKYFYQKH